MDILIPGKPNKSPNENPDPRVSADSELVTIREIIAWQLMIKAWAMFVHVSLLASI